MTFVAILYLLYHVHAPTWFVGMYLLFSVIDFVFYCMRRSDKEFMEH